jgi:hypothetical protein
VRAQGIRGDKTVPLKKVVDAAVEGAKMHDWQVKVRWPRRAWRARKRTRAHSPSGAPFVSAPRLSWMVARLCAAEGAGVQAHGRQGRLPPAARPVVARGNCALRSQCRAPPPRCVDDGRALLQAHERRYAPCEGVDSEDTAFFLFTSGQT